MAKEDAAAGRGGVMANRRNSHSQKTPAERRAYMNTVVKGVHPTQDMEPSPIEPTDAPTPEHPIQAYEPTQFKQPSRVWAFLKQEPAVALLVPLVGLLGWLFYQIYALNREIGEIKVENKTALEKYDGTEKTLDQYQQSLRRELDTLNQRILTLEQRKIK